MLSSGVLEELRIEMGVNCGVIGFVAEGSGFSSPRERTHLTAMTEAIPQDSLRAPSASVEIRAGTAARRALHARREASDRI